MVKKATSDKVSSLAGRGLAGGKLTKKERNSVYASALGQDESKRKPAATKPTKKK